jgi:N6-L-threonylcarbamoyladenine synthase
VVVARVGRVEQARELTGSTTLAVGGGVAANSELRNRLTSLSDSAHVGVKIPPPELCTDNAAMIASAARFLEPVPYPDYLAFDAFAQRAA